MSVRFLLGASGTGKSTLLIREVLRHAEKYPDAHHIVLVPEQFTFETQRQFIAAHPRGAMLNVEAISFGHMTRRVDREFSAEAVQTLDENGKEMLLSLAVRDAEKSLLVYGKQVRRPGFLRKLAGLFAEWDMNDLSPERLEEIANEERLTPLLQSKLHDLACIYAAFKARLGSGRMTAEESLPRLARLLPRSGFARGAFLYFDGFTGFTSVQYRIITELIRRSPETVFAFTLPAGEDPAPQKGSAGQTELFGMTKEALSRLERCAEEAGQLVAEPVYAAGTKRPEDLDFLEKHLLRPCGETYAGLPEHVEAVSARDVREECVAAVARLMGLVRDDGLRWRDVALVVSDQERYVPVLEELLNEADVPYFTDRRAPLVRHPLIRLIQAALEAADGLKRDSVLRFLKNECGPLSREECDVFENYLHAAGIRRGRQFSDPFFRGPKREKGESDAEFWERSERYLDEMNALRERAVSPLLRLKDAFKEARSAARYCDAVSALLEELEVGVKLAERAEAYEKEGKTTEADEWREVQGMTEKLLADTAGLLGDMKLSRPEFTDILNAGLEGLKLGLLPDEPDRLVIGDVERSRFGSVKALLFLGMNEGLVPKSENGGGLITDRERTLLGDIEPDLGYTGEKALFEARFYLYRLLTKPRSRLYMSCVRVGADGKPTNPSSVLLEICRLFPKLRIRDSAKAAAAERIYSLNTAARELASLLNGRREEDWEELYRFLAGQPAFADKLALLEKGILASYEERPISREEAKALYGLILSGNVTRLESFAACPFKHFLEFGLGLTERETPDFDGRAYGSFFHKAMEVILRECRDKGLKLKEMDGADKEKLVDHALSLAIAASTDTDIAERSDGEYYVGRWKEFFLRRLEAMSLTEENCGFVPEAFEQRFGRDVPELLLDLDEGGRMRIGGVIDRIDVLREEDTLYLRIVDYKTGDKPALDPEKLQAGLELQLPAYLAAALLKYRKEYPDKTVLPGGLYYALLKEDWSKPETPPEKALLDSAKMKGYTAAEVKEKSPDVSAGQYNENILAADTLAAFAEYAKKKMADIGTEILQGRTAVSPASRTESCRFCRFSSVCRYDRKIPGMTERQKTETDEQDRTKAKQRKVNSITEILRDTGREV